MTLQTLRLSANLEHGLLQAVGRLAPSREMDDRDVVVIVIGKGRALGGRPGDHGHPTSIREVSRWIEAAVAGLAADGSRPPAPGLTAGEASLLDAAGFDAGDPNEPGAFERSRIEFEFLVRDSLTIEAAAKHLGVGPSRLRQRLSSRERSIYGIKDGRTWRIPKFQFQNRGKLVCNIDRVLPHIRPDAHPVAVKTWFVTPHADLPVGGDDVPATPLAWLAAGGSAAVVAALAEEI